MYFEIDAQQLLRVHKLMNGFISHHSMRPNLTAIRIICDVDEQKVTFEGTDTAKCSRWIIETKVIEKGKCSVVFSKAFIYLLKAIKNIVLTKVVIYSEEDVIKANINGNIIILESVVDFPSLDKVYTNTPETYDNKPIFYIRSLEDALKAMREAGATEVRFFIPKEEGKKVIMTCEPIYKEVVVSAIVTKIRR